MSPLIFEKSAHNALWGLLNCMTMSLCADFVIPAICFAVVGFYAIIFSRKKEKGK